jgi:hypothetical protein
MADAVVGEKTIVVLDERTPVARRPRRVADLPRLSDDGFAWNQAARLKPLAVALSPLNRPSGTAGARD